VSHLGYLAVIALTVLGTLPLELLLGTRVYGRPRRLALTLLVVLVPFLAWDLFAIANGHWTFDPDQTLGVVVFGALPIEELLFFIVIPTAAVLTFEAVRGVKGWPAGDEP
jgi:lycopene cyclase domain-containing protein